VKRKTSLDGLTDEQYLAPTLRQIRVLGWMLAAALVALVVVACASWKKAVLTADDVAAQLLCGQANAERMGISVEDAVDAYCNTRPTWEPWLDAVLSARQAGAVRAGLVRGASSAPAPTNPPPQPENAPAADAGAP